MVENEHSVHCTVQFGSVRFNHAHQRNFNIVVWLSHVINFLMTMMTAATKITMILFEKGKKDINNNSSRLCVAHFISIVNINHSASQRREKKKKQLKPSFFLSAQPCRNFSLMNNFQFVSTAVAPNLRAHIFIWRSNRKLLFFSVWWEEEGKLKSSPPTISNALPTS